MSARIGVVAPAGPYRAAVAELPRSTVRSSRTEGAIVVVDATAAGWTTAAAAIDGGAAAVVVADPLRVPSAPEDLVMSGVPIIVERPRLRADEIADALGGDPSERLVFNALVAHCQIARADRGAIVRDAVGWLRALAGGPLDLLEARAGLALLAAGTAGPSASLVYAESATGSQALAVSALGAVRVEVEIDAAGTRLRRVDRAGALTPPRRFESPQRLALRRAREAVAGGTRPSDLADLLLDTRLAAQLIRA